MANKKTFILDTSVYLTDADSINAFKNNDIVIPLKVLEEIDKHKKRQDGVGLHARKTIRTLDELRSRGCLQKGVRLGKGKGIVSVRTFDPSELPPDLDPSIPDHIIIATALSEKSKNSNKKVILVSRDINMRVICDAVGVPSEDYMAPTIVTEMDQIYDGFASVLVDDELIEQYYNDEEVVLEEGRVLHPNQYIMLVSNQNEKKTALARYISSEAPLKKIMQFRKGIWGIKSRNKEQMFAMDMLLNPEIQVVSLIGKAGSGKTLCAIAAGLEQSMESGKEEPIYRRLIVSRPVQPLGKDIGYLPGTLEDKMAPWLAPVQDNLRFLMGDDNVTLEMYMEKGKIEIEALTYIRGRSISNSYIVIDEAQNLTTHEIKTIITRVGEGTKVILTGDIEQIDNVYLDEKSNGLVYAVEKFKHHSIAGHVTLQKGERSKVATIAAQIL
jgi:PhoH-like ATPase